ncbi:hypothetical protein QUV80_00565 [Paraclostridium benzoelyticum]|nr:hypothetical protein [Paraclostridium benzoelyticum]
MYKGLLTIKVTDEITNFPIEGVSINICAIPKEGSTKSKYIYKNLITNSSGMIKKFH